MTNTPHRSRRRGLSLLEVAMALGVSAVAMIAMLQLSAQSAAEIKARAAADRLAQVTSAAKNYVRTNFTQITANAGPHGGGGTLVVLPTGAGPGVGGLPSLQGGGFLPSAYVDTNPYGQQHAVLIREAAANRIEVVVTTYGGQTIQDNDLGRIAAKVGAEGGFMMTSPTSAAMAGQVQGAYGGWRTPAATWANGTATPSTGHVMAALGFDNGTVLSDYLYRYDIGVPEANRMETAIDMNNNDINNTRQLDVQRIVNDVGNVQVNDNLDVSDSATVANDLTVGRDTGVARDLWVGRNSTTVGDSLVNRNLTVNQNATINQNATVGQTMTAQRARVNPGALTGWPGSWGDGIHTWDLYAEGTIGVGSGGAVRAAMDRNGVAWADSYMRAPAFFDADNTGYVADPNGLSRLNTVQADWLNTDTLVYGSSRTGGYRLGDLLPRYVFQGAQFVQSGSQVWMPNNCGPGGQPRIILSLHQTGWGRCTNNMFCGNAGGYVSMWATGGGYPWTVHIYQENIAITAYALAQTACYYP